MGLFCFFAAVPQVLPGVGVFDVRGELVRRKKKKREKWSKSGVEKEKEKRERSLKEKKNPIFEKKI